MRLHHGHIQTALHGSQCRLHLIQSKRDACQQALAFVRDFRDWFDTECLAGGTPWTPAIQARLTKQRGERIRLPARVDWQALADESHQADRPSEEDAP